jgi:threonyl-tRNA synthetase
MTYRDGRASTRPPRIHDVVPVKESGTFSDVLLVFVTVEAQDSLSTAALASDAVVALLDQNVASGGCVVMPFAHLSRNLAEPRLAERLVRAVADGVGAIGRSVALTSFGFHKSLDLHMSAFGHPGSVAFREF